MEQKDYKMEIVLKLMEKESYGRELAKLVGTNHMTIIRRLGELMRMNVLDYREEGRNKVYFIKSSDEARNYLFMSEYYKLMKILGEYPLLRKIFRELQENEDIELAVLFGSYAKGLSNKNSDIDIYVETNSKKIKTDLEEKHSKLSVKIGEYNPNNLLIQEIEKNHVIIKGVERYYEKVGIFKKN